MERIVSEITGNYDQKDNGIERYTIFFLVVVETIHAKVTRENQRTNEKKISIQRKCEERKKCAPILYNAI